MKQTLIIQLEKTVLKLADVSRKGEKIFIHRMRRFNLPPSIENGDCCKDPDAFAEFVVSCIEKGRMKRNEAIIIMRSEPTIQKEYRHDPLKPSQLMSLALLEAEAILPEDEGAFIIENMRYGAFKDKDGQERSAIFGIHEESVTKLVKAMKTRGVPLVGIVPAVVAHSVFCGRFLNFPGMAAVHFDKTVLFINISPQESLISIFYRGNLIHQRVEDFQISKIFNAAAEKFSIETDDINDYFSRIGFEGRKQEYSNQPELFEFMQESAAPIISKIGRSLNVIMSGDDLTMDQVLLCGESSEFPGIAELVNETLGVPCNCVSEYPERLDALVELVDELKDRPDLLPPLVIFAGGERKNRKNMNFLSKGLEAKKKRHRDMLVHILIFVAMLAVMSILPLSYLISLKDEARNAAMIASPKYVQVQALLTEQHTLQSEMAAVQEERDRLPFGRSDTSKYLTLMQEKLFANGIVNGISYNGATKSFTVLLSVADLDSLVKAKNDLNAGGELKVSIPMTLHAENGRWICQIEVEENVTDSAILADQTKEAN